jgi:N utilization substance protein B
MSFDPYKSRELVFLLIYNLDMGETPNDDLVELIMAECRVAKKHVQDALARAELIWKERQTCDAMIQKVCHEYSIDRIQSVERNVLRLSVYELIIEKTLPPKVVIAEGKRLAKKFSTDDAAVFVHTLLGALCGDIAV